MTAAKLRRSISGDLEPRSFIRWCRWKPEEILSNGKYKAVLHRSTVNKEKTRMSWPVFIEPPPSLEIGPIQSLVNQQNSSKYKTKKFCDYAYCKLNKIPQ